MLVGVLVIVMMMVIGVAGIWFAIASGVACD